MTLLERIIRGGQPAWLGRTGAHREPASGNYQRDKIFAAGRFWKRFDRVENGVATGEVVNYNIEWLPGYPEVRSVPYPDDQRTYFQKGQVILLLNYRNNPYRRI